ncbi:MAG: HAMP domain-containing protein [Desulfohalobiaceae bacterium]|nr:HAMP domain-containing protein [Desulfohalobiaceae bacterium]
MNLRISIRRKVLLTFSLFFLVSLLVTVFGYYKYHVLNQKIRLIETKETLLNSILEARRYEKNFFITLERQHLEIALIYANKSRENLGRLIRGFSDVALPSDIERQLNILEQYSAQLKILLESYQTDPSGFGPSSESLSDLIKIKSTIRSLGRELTVAMEGALQKERQHVKKLIRQSRWYLFVFLGLILFIACVTFLFLIHNVDRPLKTIEEAINRIVSGDYKAIPEIRTGDEFEKLVDSLNTMLKELERRNSQLIQSEKMAALGTLTSGVAHELNNPLNNISTSLQIILEELEEGDLEYQRGLLEESEGEVKRARGIVKSLLEFSRETEFSLSRVNFADLVQSTLKKLIQGEIPGTVQVNVEVPRSISAFLDPRRIQQVLLNLIINATQAMDDEGGVLTIRAFEQEDGRGFFFQVEDSGQGIAAKELPKIFDPFYTSKEFGKGSGLGLSISKGIIESHKGSIEARSREKEGTVFSVFLPYSPQDQQEA